MSLPDFGQFCEAACVKLWGEPTRKTKKEWRWNGGDHYGYRTFNPSKRTWYDADQRRGGSTLQLVSYAKGEPACELKGAAFFETWGEAHKMELVPDPPPPPKANGGDRPIIAAYPYRDDKGALSYEVVRYDTTDRRQRFKQRRPDGADGWIWNLDGVSRLPYRLPELIAASPAAVVYQCEGEKDADALRALGFTATTASGGAKTPWHESLTPYFKDRHVVILPDADAPGRAHAQKVAAAINGVAASVRVLDLFPERRDGSDVSDWIADDRAGAKLAKLAKDAPLWEPTADKPGDDEAGKDDAEIAKLARMSPLDYAREHKAAAKRLGISRLALLDALVKAKRSELGFDGTTKEPAPPLYEHWNVEPASDPVDGGILLRALKEAIRRYVFMTDEQVVAITLWTVVSWVHEHEGAVTHSPILLVTSAEKDSGKTTLLGVLNFLMRRSLASVEISGPALFRSITKWQPTLIVDEADKAFVKNDDLRSVINSGWTRGQGVIRCHSETHEPELFSTFAPKIVGMKGRDLEDTTLSRSIIIEMRPKRAVIRRSTSPTSTIWTTRLSPACALN